MTGHSLGGALSTLCGFYAAADDALVSLLPPGKPIRVLSFASPYVGNCKFLLAFQALERCRRLQHLRVAYEKDVVTLMPIAAPKLGMLSPAYAMFNGAGNLYKHVGMKLLLLGQDKGSDDYLISFPQDQSTDESYAEEIKNFIQDGKNLLSGIGLAFNNKVDEVAKYHGCDNYEDCIVKCKENLVKYTIDDLYNNKDIVGKILDSDYEPQMMFTAAERVQRIMASDTLKQTFAEIFNGK